MSSWETVGCGKVLENGSLTALLGMMKIKGVDKATVKHNVLNMG
jgi:hypothetical protein